MHHIVLCCVNDQNLREGWCGDPALWHCELSSCVHSWPLIPVPAAVGLTIQRPSCVPGETAEGGPRAAALTAPVGDPDGVLAPGLSHVDSERVGRHLRTLPFPLSPSTLASLQQRLPLSPEPILSSNTWNSDF